MTESQLKQVIEFAHQAGQRNAGIDASPQAARDYYQNLVQDGGLSFVSKRVINPNHRAKSDCCNSDMDLGSRDVWCNKCGKSCTWHTIDITTGEPVC